MSIETEFKNFKKEIIDQSFHETYSLSFTYNNGNFLFKLSKGIDPCYWEETFKLSNLQAEYKFLSFFEKDTEFFDFLVNCFTENNVALSEASNNIRSLIFSISLNNNMKKQISFKLKIKKTEISESVSHIIDHLSQTEQSYEQMKKEFEANRNCLKKQYEEHEDQVNKKLETMMSMIEKLKQENAQKQSFHNNIEMVCNDFYFVPGSNNGNFSLKNKTLKRISNSSWLGFRCNAPENVSAKMSFSVRIDNVNLNKGIMIGWCMKNADNSFGYHQTAHSFCIYLYNGQFWNRGSSQDYVNNRVNAKKGDIYTAVIYTYEKKIEFLLNGSSLSAPKTIEFNNEDAIFLCPFVDLCDTGIQVSIVDPRNSFI